MPNSSLCHYSDAYILVSGTITVEESAANGGNNNVQVVFKNCAPFTDSMSKINNIKIDNAIDIDVVMPMYNSIKCSNNYSKISGSLWQYYKNEPTLTDAGAVDNFPVNSTSFKVKENETVTVDAGGTKTVKIMVPLKYQSNFWRGLEMPFFNSETNLILTWSENCIISNATANQETTFTITDIKFYIPVVTLSAQDNVKLLHLLKSGFKRTINWNKYQSKTTAQAPN